MRDAERWIRKAESDLIAARHLLTLTTDCPFDSVCYHAQQCAEKHLKALLVALGVRFPKTHDLVLLANLVPSPQKLNLPATDLELLGRYSLEARYPGDWEPFDRAQSEAAIELAVRIQKEVHRALQSAI